MNKYNIDKFISGGYIFDKLDRYAQIIALTRTNKKHAYTSWAFPKYLKQLCKDDYALKYNWCFKIGKRIFVKTSMRNNDGLIVATCIFCFVETDKNYCEKKNDAETKS